MSSLNEKLNDITQQKGSLLKKQAITKKQLKARDDRINSFHRQVEKARIEFNDWVKMESHALEHLKQQVETLERYRLRSGITTNA